MPFGCQVCPRMNSSRWQTCTYVSGLDRGHKKNPTHSSDAPFSLERESMIPSSSEKRIIAEISLIEISCNAGIKSYSVANNTIEPPLYESLFFEYFNWFR